MSKSLASAMTTPAATSAAPAPTTGKTRKPRKVKIDPATGQPVKRDPAIARAKAARKWAEANGVGPALAVITSPAVRDLIGSQALAVNNVERRVAALTKRIERTRERAKDAEAALATHLPALKDVVAALSGVGAKQIAALESAAKAAAEKAAKDAAADGEAVSL